MESNTTEQDLSLEELPLEEPHFDEEATVLSARPVVPLEVVEAKSRSVRHLLIGSAIVVALLIGAVVATSIYRFRGDQQASSATATEDLTPQSQPSVEAGVAAVESQEPEPIVASQEPEPPASDKEQPDERAVRNVPATSPPLISRESPPRAPKVVKSRKQNGQDQTLDELIVDQRQLDMEIRRAARREERRAARREERYAERREERRPRRVEREASHQGGDREARSTDDLLRIREIFEGRPKP